ncbi:MAG: DUF167 domain-containing protein [Gammaproteobacteria bacterium]|nr:DUF167 domain-containing protein [Gammaproteobacteria bacterium]
MLEDLKNWKVCAGDRLTVRVAPNASSNRIKVEKTQDGSTRLRVYVTVPAESGKANEAVLKLLAKALEVPKSALLIVRGELSQDKIIKILK